ncbi:glycosyltransferase family 39 protein [Nocardia sp. NPDC020380]|uniref:glycosyltransferase family 39 protein n=1 Tax=Nocardia sp. NPDC020380 TaxID=3364309 RepID=UPI0037A96E4F
MYWVAALFATLLTTLSGRYGYHRDELYFLAAGHRMAWGYPDQPPLVPLLARTMSAIDPNSLMVLRIPATLAATAVVLCAGLMARELGGGRAAQTLSAGAAAAAPLLYGAGHLLSTTVFDLMLWSLIVLLTLRLLRPEPDPRWWLAIGVLSGLALQNKALAALPLLALAVALALTGSRKIFATRYFPLAIVIAALIFAPYLRWQAEHGWPQWTVARSIAAGSSGTSNSPIQFVLLQFGLVGPLLVPLWGFGLWWLARQARYRAFALTYAVLFLFYLCTGGKAYYLGGMYPVLAAAGAVALIDRLTSTRIRRAATGSVIAANALVGAILFLPVLPISMLRGTPVLAIDYDAGETIGWPRFVTQVADIRARVAPGAGILTGNYGEAGAIERFGAGLPTPHSVQNSYWWWGPPADSETVLVLGFSATQLDRFCIAPEPVGRIDDGVGIHNDEQGKQVYLCRTPRQPWQDSWFAMRRLG